MKKLILSLAILQLAFGLGAQNVLPLGKWQTHLPYTVGKYVTQSPNTVFYGTDFSILAIDKKDLSHYPISKTEGLSQSGIQLIKYVPDADILLSIYTNGVIDLIHEDEVITNFHIKNFQNIAVGKTVNEVFIENDSLVLLAASFGISRLNVNSSEFNFTTFSGINVNSVAQYDGYIYACTDEGIYRSAANNFFIEDFATWELLGATNGFPADYSSGMITVYNNRLYFDIDGQLFRLTPDQAPLLVHEEGNEYVMEFLTSEGAHLLVGYQCPNNCRGQILFLDENEMIGAVPQSCNGIPTYAVQDDEGRIWMADLWRGLRMLPNVSSSACDYFNINSPFSEKAYAMDIVDDQLWVAAGGISSVYSPLGFPDGIYSFINGTWTTYNSTNNSIMKGEDSANSSDDLEDMIAIAYSDNTNKVYAGSYLEGLAVFGETSQLYNEHNSTLENDPGDLNGKTRIGGLAIDDKDNVWISNPSAPEHAISILKPDGTWQAFNHTCGQNFLFDIAIDANGYKWIIIGKEQAGVLLFDEGDIDDLNDDRCRTLSASNSNLVTNDVQAIAADLDGDIWVGTSEGVIIFECGGSAFDSDICKGSRRIVQGTNGFGGYLFETEFVQAIAVDGANRKWIGTTNGVYLVSPNGEDLIQRFTEDNSPLLDNNVTSIEVNQKTGEVFFGTDKGIVSYQSDAIEGTVVNRKNIEVFPNPIRPEYQGKVTIKGLARDATVKITDIKGRLVYETNANGGEAVWDNRDYNGRRVNSGVYLVFSTANSRYVGLGDPDSAVARIVVVSEGN